MLIWKEKKTQKLRSDYHEHSYRVIDWLQLIVWNIARTINEATANWIKKGPPPPFSLLYAMRHISSEGLTDRKETILNLVTYVEYKTSDTDYTAKSFGIFLLLLLCYCKD
jgi:hypothetical protein